MESALIVGNDENYLRPIFKVLKEMSFEIQVAATGGEGLEYCRSYRPDVVVASVNLPDGVTGLDLAQEARKDRPDTIAILISDYPEVDEKNKDSDPGILYFETPVRTGLFKKYLEIEKDRRMLRHKVDTLSEWLEGLRTGATHEVDDLWLAIFDRLKKDR